MASKYTLKLKHHFAASHHLILDYKSPCQRNHGHTFDVLVEIVSNSLDPNGMIIDFKKIKGIINKLDHQNLNEILDFNPTAENIAKYLQNEIRKEVLGEVKVTIWESPNASITYEESD